MKKSEIDSASIKELRSMAAKNKIKFIGVTEVDLRKTLLAIADDEKSKPAKKESKPAKSAKKAAEPKMTVVKDAKKNDAAPSKKESKPLSDADKKIIDGLGTKKAKVITLREKGYSIAVIAEATDLHPTNVSRYIRDAGLSTSTAKVPAERISRIKATIASKKESEEAAAPVKKAAKDKK